MGRHSADVMAKLTVRVPRGHQGYWEIVRKLARTQGTFTAKEVHGHSNTPHAASVRDYLRRLERAGYIAPVETPQSQGRRYTLKRDQPEAPRLRRDGSPARDMGRGNEQMWRAIKMIGAFTARELAIHASTDEVPVKPETAKSYCKALHRAGYLIVGQDATRGRRGQPRVYRLRPDRNTGPLAPQIQRTDWVWDPNTKTVMGPEGGDDG